MFLLELVFPLLGLLPVLLALWYLRRQRHRPQGGPASALRGLALVVLVLFVAGFGVCGAWGTITGLVSLFTGSGEARAYAPAFLLVGGVGLAIAGGLVWLFRWVTRPEPGAPAPAEAVSINPFDPPPPP